LGEATAEQLRAELRAALDANTDRLIAAILVELARDVTLEAGRRLQFEVDPFFYGISSCASEESVLVDWLDEHLPANWYERAEAALGGWDALVWEELCPWFAAGWRQAGGPAKFSPAFLFFHDYHRDQYDLEGERWLSGAELEAVWDGPGGQ
jgi:hypothetical protein